MGLRDKSALAAAASRAPFSQSVSTVEVNCVGVHHYPPNTERYTSQMQFKHALRALTFASVAILCPTSRLSGNGLTRDDPQVFDQAPRPTSATKTF
jgi:hypothetical protein